MGQTRVDLQHLLEDLRDAYTGSLEETVLTEIVANSLDSGARLLTLTAAAGNATLAITDDGAGMTRREIARYHDLASSGKSRGEGIGFAGVGIKLGLLLSEEVTTETRRASTHVATSWRLASRQRAPWNWVPAPGRLQGNGTAVVLRLRNPLSPLLDGGFLEETLRRHFQPILDRGFADVLAEHYGAGVLFLVNGRPLGSEEPHGSSRSPLALKLPRRRRPSAFGYLWREADGAALPEGSRGLAVSTFGKVIKRGWDWLGVFPANPDSVGGLVEAPLLSASLTLAKNDFVRTGSSGAVYLAFRKALQEAVSTQLEAWGSDTGSPERRERRTRPYEKDLAAVLEDLTEEFPLLISLVEKRAGGQKKLPVGEAIPHDPDARTLPVVPEMAPTPASKEPEVSNASALGDGEPERERPSTADRVPSIELPARAGRRKRHVGLGLHLRFETRPESDEPARLAENILWINESHHAYRRAAASRSEGYHVAFAAAMALSRIAVEPADQRSFVNVFLSRWGEALDRPRRRTRRRRKNLNS